MAENYLLSNRFQRGLAGYLGAMQPQYAVGQFPQQIGPGQVMGATQQGLLQGRQQDTREKFGKKVRETGYAGLFDDPESLALMAEMDPEGFMEGVMAMQVAQNRYKGLGDLRTPMTVKEWEYFNGLSPEDQRKFLIMKRADKVVNTGADQQRIPQLPGMPPEVVAENTLKPGEEPRVRGEQARAAGREGEIGKAEGVRAAQGVDQKEVLKLTEGIEDTIKRSTGGGFASAIDSVARFFSLATPGAVAAAELKPLQGALLRYVPRMEGPQSDADREVYIDATGRIADTGYTVEERLAALDTVKRIARKYGFADDVFVGNATGSSGEFAPVPSGNVVNFNDLPG